MIANEMPITGKPQMSAQGHCGYRLCGVCAANSKLKNAAGVFEHNSTTAQQHNSTTAQQHNSTTAQQHNSTTAQQHNSTTAQQYTPLLNNRVYYIFVFSLKKSINNPCLSGIKPYLASYIGMPSAYFRL
jgi:hypothetical protein